MQLSGHRTVMPNQYHRYQQKCPPASLPAASNDDVLWNAQFHLAISQIVDANIVDISTAGVAYRSMQPAALSSAHDRRVRRQADQFFVSVREEISRQDGSCLHDLTARRAPSRSCEGIA